jgi:hypothetical protein
MAHLSAKAFALDRGHAQDANLGKGGFDGVELVWLDDGFDHLHR